ncbi:MAG: N-6 DNA methylase [Desulfomonilaceae bacterium]|nr:N-6 DNA methylase [Desulfomonilaceae bacterium]
MNNDPGNHHTRVVTNLFLPEVIRGLLRSCGSETPDLSVVYRTAVGRMVDALLSEYDDACRSRLSPQSRESQSLLAARLTAEIGTVEPEEVGRIYEHLKGLRLVLDTTHEPVLECHAGERRNRGLFYTPTHIVRHIVSTTLDQLEISSPLDLLDFRILDPAVGGGLFPAEALAQLTERILGATDDPRFNSSPQLTALREKFAEQPHTATMGPKPDLASAVRLHVVDHCLYGVDPDPVAVTITRALLMRRAAGDLPFVPRVEPNIRQGNSLIGEDGRSGANLTRAEAHLIHGGVYAGTGSEQFSMTVLCERLGMIHWPLEYPEVFQRDNPGFDVIVGNPPYEIVSVKESGITERRREQAYFRRMYRTCKGKINTYRLMLERCLGLLRRGGVLGFIVPATLLADSTASKLRREILAESRVCHAVVIPEKARIFEKVTQALLIIVTRKGAPTHRMETMFWDGTGPIDQVKGVEVSRQLIEKTNLRIPLLRSVQEKELLEILLTYPPLAGDGDIHPVAEVHQGEINLTTHRRFITSQPTRFPLIRGEHLQPFSVRHPSRRNDRLDWLCSDFLDRYGKPSMSDRSDTLPLFPSVVRTGIEPWEGERIAVGRVVNMAAATRLKAAYVPAGSFLGDMTNSVTDLQVPMGYLLGLLNSRLLNWRIKTTSTNNYLSAAEIDALPIPRAPTSPASHEQIRGLSDGLVALLPRLDGPLERCVKILEDSPQARVPSGPSDVTAAMLEWAVGCLQSRANDHAPIGDMSRWRNLVDALVLKLFGVEHYAGLVET